MSLAHITLDIDDGLKALILQLWTTRRVEIGGVAVELPDASTRITIEGKKIHIEPPLKVSGPILGSIRAATTVSAISCDPAAQTITIDLNRSPVDVRIV